MKFSEFIVETCRTFNYQNPKRDFQHCILGLIDEIGELSGAVKKKVGYDQVINVTNVKEEIGDLSYFLAQLTYLNKAEEPFRSQLYDTLDKGTMMKRKANKISTFDDIVYINRHITMIIDLYDGEEKSIDFIKAYGTLTVQLVDILASLATRCGTTYSSILDGNIAKLKERHPDKFNPDAVDEVGRDRTKEAEAVESKTK